MRILEPNARDLFLLVSHRFITLECKIYRTQNLPKDQKQIMVDWTMGIPSTRQI